MLPIGIITKGTHSLFFVLSHIDYMVQQIRLARIHTPQQIRDTQPVFVVEFI